MSEKMLVTQALDERDLLVKKIADKIANASTEITTSYGTFTVAGAIALRSRLRGAGAYGGDADFEGRLQKKLASEYNERVQFCDRKNNLRFNCFVFYLNRQR